MDVCVRACVRACECACPCVMRSPDVLCGVGAWVRGGGHPALARQRLVERLAEPPLVAANQPLQSHATQTASPPTGHRRQSIDAAAQRRRAVLRCAKPLERVGTRQTRVRAEGARNCFEGAHIGEAATTSKRAQMLEVCFVAAWHGTLVGNYYGTSEQRLRSASQLPIGRFFGFLVTYGLSYGRYACRTACCRRAVRCVRCMACVLDSKNISAVFCSTAIL